MTRDDIIRMAREAGFADGAVDIIGLDGFANFANLVAAHTLANIDPERLTGATGHINSLEKDNK